MSDTDHAAIYRGVRLRVTEFVSALPDEVLDRVAPATPRWRVRDLVSHLAGTTADIVSGNLVDVAGDTWTQEQVDARADVPLRDVLVEWERCSRMVEPLIGGFDPTTRRMLLTDAVTHELDVRGAAGDRGGRTSDAVDYVFGGVSPAIGGRRGGRGALRIVHEAGDTVVGGGAVTATVRTSRFEIVRAAVGRRSTDEVDRWDWSGDAMPETVVLPRFAPSRATPLDE